MVIQKLSFLHHFKKYNRHQSMSRSQRPLTPPGLPSLPPGPSSGKLLLGSCSLSRPVFTCHLLSQQPLLLATPLSPPLALLPTRPSGAFLHSSFVLRVRAGVLSTAFPSPKMGFLTGDRTVLRVKLWSKKQWCQAIWAALVAFPLLSWVTLRPPSSSQFLHRQYDG